MNIARRSPNVHDTMDYRSGAVRRSESKAPLRASCSRRTLLLKIGLVL